MFQWQKDGVTLTSETNMALTLVDVSASSDGGTYTCIVSNEAGNDTGMGDLYISPEITAQPASINTSVLLNHEFECVATGFPLPQFEWIKVGGNLTGNFSGENTATLRLTPVQFGDEGDYFCRVTSGNSTIDSEVARLASEWQTHQHCISNYLMHAFLISFPTGERYCQCRERNF